ncbi:alpha/beta-hydrolase N-terminal domain-containing protein [Burkholderia contaminans]|uniref:alpha/beta-hydrolase N-terminal domain-containing protein n=1 Tax=Burkholderia contaminans TaxID=488447 RepID=UPI003B28A74D
MVLTALATFLILLTLARLYRLLSRFISRHADRVLPRRVANVIGVLVALALMALVSLMAWRGLDSVSSARDWIAQQSDDTDAIVRTLGQMGRDDELAYNGPSFAAPGIDTQVFTTGVRLLRGAAGAPRQFPYRSKSKYFDWIVL